MDDWVEKAKEEMMGEYAEDAFERDIADWAREEFPQMPNSPYDEGLEDDKDMPDVMDRRGGDVLVVEET